MPSKIFINLPVKDLERTTTFFTKLGFTFNQQFTNENATSMVVSDSIYVMLLVEPFFKTFTSKEIIDAKKSTEVILSLSFDSRAEVDTMLEKAKSAGATIPNDGNDHGWMYQKSFEDLDGHIWEVFWMDPAAVNPS